MHDSVCVLEIKRWKKHEEVNSVMTDDIEAEPASNHLAHDYVKVSDPLRERQQSALECSTTAIANDSGVECHTSGLTGIPASPLTAVSQALL